MTNHGDITQIHGGNVEPAWVVIGGSPCQDLSVAGKRAGLEGERSGLFMEPQAVKEALMMRVEEYTGVTMRRVRMEEARENGT